MRTTLTVLIAISLSLAVGVTSASAEVYLDACRGKSGTKYRLVEDRFTDCKKSEVGTLLRSGADDVTVLDDSTYHIVRRSANSLNCNLWDINVGQTVNSSRDVSELYVLCPSDSAIYHFETKYFYLYVNCRDFTDGLSVSPQNISMTCVLD